MLAEKLLSGSTGSTLYVDDVFSTWLYTGNGSTQTITNGIDLSTNGGMVWQKCRTTAQDHHLWSTVIGVSKSLTSNNTTALYDYSSLGSKGVTAFNSNGFTINGNAGDFNSSTDTYASWTFRKAAKFFDVVTYTGDGSTDRVISHSLGIAPGMIIVKATSSSGSWYVWQRTYANLTDGFLMLNAINAYNTSPNTWGTTPQSASTFTVSSNGNMNSAGVTYVAYLFAHDTASTGIIQCGSFATGVSGSGYVNLSFEPQFVLMKRASGGVSDWVMGDIYRGMPISGNGAKTLKLFPNLSSAETGTGAMYRTGMNRIDYDDGVGAGDIIYIAIRRPNKPPTSGTQVYTAVSGTGGSTTTPCFISGFPVDFAMLKNKAANAYWADVSRLQGSGVYLQSSSTAAEATNSNMTLDYSTGWSADPTVSTNFFSWMFKRAPCFMDVVCYTGTGSANTIINHNLGVSPEMILFKQRNATQDWFNVFSFTATNCCYNYLNRTDAQQGPTAYASAVIMSKPTSSQFELNFYGGVNGSAQTYVAYLFATLAGISKVGSYTGNGSTQTINCGFSTGARFVLIKRTDAAGDWYTFDTARGMTTLTDPYLLLNSTAAETATLGAVTTTSVGFALNSAILAAINVSGGSYIYLSVA